MSCKTRHDILEAVDRPTRHMRAGQWTLDRLHADGTICDNSQKIVLAYRCPTYRCMCLWIPSGPETCSKERARQQGDCQTHDSRLVRTFWRNGCSIHSDEATAAEDSRSVVWSRRSEQRGTSRPPEVEGSSGQSKVERVREILEASVNKTTRCSRGEAPITAVHERS